MNFQEIEELKYGAIADKVFALIGEAVKFELPVLSGDDRTDYEGTRLYTLDESGNEVDFDHPEFSVIKDLMSSVKSGLKKEKSETNLNTILASDNFAKAMINLGLFDPKDRVIVPRIAKKFCEEDDTITIEAILVESKRLDDADKVIEEEEKLIATGEAVEKVCTATLKLVTGMNATSQMADADIDQMQVDFEDVENWLRRTRPEKALKLLIKMQPTTVVTQGMIDKVKNFLTKKLIEIGAIK